jgi:GntR family transcriptional regulator
VVRDVAYKALATRLRESISAGEYSDGRPMPTEMELAAGHSVSRSTVRRAMQDLVADGIISRVAGRGTYVVAGSDRYIRNLSSIEDLMALALDTECEVLSPLSAVKDASAADRLGLETDDVVSLTIRRLYESVPFQLTTATMSPELGGLLADVPELTTPGARSRITVIGLIDARRPRLVMGAQQTISAGPAPAFAAKYLTCAEGSPVLEVDRVYTDVRGVPVELGFSYFDPKYYRYQQALRRRLP